MVIKSGAKNTSCSGGRGVARTDYISREGAYSKSGLENERGELYLNGEDRLNYDEIKAVKAEIRQSDRERGIILSPENKDLTKEEMLTLSKDIIDHKKLESGKEFSYVVSIHDHNGRTHAHVEAWTDKRQDLFLSPKEMQKMEEFGKEREKDLTEERIIDTGKNLEKEPERERSIEQDRVAIREREDERER